MICFITVSTEYGYNSVDKKAVWKINLWTDGIHLLDNGKTKIGKKTDK